MCESLQRLQVVIGNIKGIQTEVY